MKKLQLKTLTLLLVIVGSLLLTSAARAADDWTLLQTQGILSAAETEKPQEEVLTRGELVALLNRTFGIYTTTGSNYSDVLRSHPYYYELMAAKSHGYLTGYDDNTVRPDESISRLQAAVLIDRLSGLLQPADGPVLGDAASIPTWGSQAVQRVVAADIMQTSGLRANFQPNDGLTRGEAYAALQTIVEKQLNLSRQDTLMQISAHDGYTLEGRLSAPMGEAQIEKLVIYVNGSGPNTYENRRESADVNFRYFDFFADAFVEQGTAFFSYNTRGVSVTEQNPFYTIDATAYRSYQPENSAKDIANMLTALRRNPRLANAKVYLLGWSEGAIIAPLAVLEAGVEVDGLLLAGYPNANMRDILEWQLGGPQIYRLMQIYFGGEDTERITKEQYEADPYQVIGLLFDNATFEELDHNEDGYLTVADAAVLTAERYSNLMTAITGNDYAWISKNYMELTPEWFQAHFALGSTEEMLVQLDLPIHIFHGTYDMNCPVEGVYAVEQRFQSLGKTNLSTHIFEQADHDLNFTAWLMSGSPSRGIAEILATVESL